MSPTELMKRTIHWICPCCGELARANQAPTNCVTCGRRGAAFEAPHNPSLPSD